MAGGALGKHMGYTPYGDCPLVQCGAECMLPDGQMLRTGMGGIANSRTWRLYRYAFGPYLDGLLMRSDVAVTIRLGLWVMGEPPGYRPFMVQLSQPQSLANCKSKPYTSC